MIYYKKKSWIKKLKNKISEKFVFKNIPAFSFSKTFFVSIFLIFILFYFSYLFLAPKFINENNVKNVINNYILKNSKLEIDIDNFSIKTGYKFDINLKADSVNLNYPNKTNFISAKKIYADINIFSLLFGFMDFDKIKISKITINTTFYKNKYDCFNYFNFNQKNTNSKFKLRNINFECNNFIFNLQDKNVNKTFLADFNKLKVQANDFTKNILITSNGKILVSNHKISDLNLKILTKINPNSNKKFIDKLTKLDYNPFQYANQYQFYSNTDIDLKFNSLDKKSDILGKIALNNYTFNINGIKLPKNNLSLIFKNNKIYTNSDFKFINNQKIQINSIVSPKTKFIEATLKSSEIDLADLNQIIGAINKIFNSKLNIDEINLIGKANINLYLKSNFKTIISKGNLKIDNAKLTHKKTGLILRNINSNINFDNNNINILNTSAYINDAKFNLEGKIDSNTNLDIKIYSNEMNIAQVLTLLNDLPFGTILNPHLKKYNFTNGLLKINSSIKGKLQNPIFNTNSQLYNFSAHSKENKFDFKAEKINFTTLPSKTKTPQIKANILNTIVIYENKKLKAPNIDLKISENNIEIPKTKIFFDDFIADFSGIIKNYKTAFVHGLFNIELKQNKENNFIKIDNKNVHIKANLSYKQDKLSIINCALLSDDVILAQIFGSISKYQNTFKYDNLKIQINEKIKISLLKNLQSGFELLGNIELKGELTKPNILAKLNLYNVVNKNLNLYAPELFLTAKNSKYLISIPKGKIYDFNFDILAELNHSKDKLIFNFVKFNSDYINLDTFFKYLTINQNSQNLNYEIKNLSADITTLETSNLLLNSVFFESSVKNNVLNIQNLTAQTLNGSISANGLIDLKRQKIQTNLTLKELNIRLLPNNLKELLIATSGKLSAKIDAKFQGINFDEIIRTFDGDIKFNIENGELSQFAKLERFLQAGNILSQSVLKLSLNSALSALSKQNSGDFKIIEGLLKIKNSIANIEYIKSQGSNMSLFIVGDFNLITQYANMKILGKIPVSTVNIMGNFGKFSLNQQVDKMSEDTKEIIKSITASPFEKKLSVEDTYNEIYKIPNLAYQTPSTLTREFIVLIDGISKNISSIIDFKWLIKP